MIRRRFLVNSSASRRASSLTVADGKRGMRPTIDCTRTGVTEPSGVRSRS